ncbi:hypothetical protein LO763_23640 [Glycomyces sp. A-F 0318]|uniref:hypothetical protein n=1 Tax=Glycomyces amatae TaxID=2881355 RepID=UPI001E378F59|nr:hypothetical protein [Glycomyces amatae]MCD0446615.1 hypothetical protein [Glycomyces amatae]
MPYRSLSLAAAATALILSGSASTASTRDGEAGGFYADVALNEGEGRCEANDVPVGAAPPAAVTVKASDAPLGCTGPVRLDLKGDLAVVFDDAEGTAAIGAIRVDATKFGFTCGYESGRVVFERDGATRTYTGGPYRGEKVEGPFVCPDAVNLDSASLTFHR